MTCASLTATSAWTLVLLSVGCASPASPAALSVQAPLASDSSTVCQALAERFVGLPALANSTAESTTRPTPLAGRWWIRQCSASLHGGELQLRLRGPGWYFVDENGSDLSLHQQVPFNLGVELDGRVSAKVSDGVFSLWLEPNREPEVDLRASQQLDIRASSAWGALLQVMPLVPLQAMAAERFADAASSALRSKLREGATATYDFASGQSDATLGRLGLGRTPPRAFQDHTPWLVNERLLLAPLALHVVGPITPGPTRLDVNVEQGTGVAYRAVCDSDMDQSYSAFASGRLNEIPNGVFVANGAVSGSGQHTSDFRVDGCRFYLVVSALAGSPSTLASLRVRG